MSFRERAINPIKPSHQVFNNGNDPITLESVPVNRLLSKYMPLSNDKWPIDEGIVPDSNRFDAKLSKVSRLNNPI